MLFASRAVALVLVLGLPMGVLAVVGLVYLIRRLTQSGRRGPERPDKKELDRMKIEDL